TEYQSRRARRSHTGRKLKVESYKVEGYKVEVGAHGLASVPVNAISVIQNYACSRSTTHIKRQSIEQSRPSRKVDLQRGCGRSRARCAPGKLRLFALRSRKDRIQPTSRRRTNQMDVRTRIERKDPSARRKFSRKDRRRENIQQQSSDKPRRRDHRALSQDTSVRRYASRRHRAQGIAMG